MSAGRVIGGLLAFFAGLLVMIIVVVNIDAINLGGSFLAGWVINLIIGILVVFGGLIGFGSRSPGALVIVCGIVSMILGIFSALVVDLAVLFGQYSTFQIYLSVGPWTGITLESIFMVIGGIFIAASGK